MGQSVLTSPSSCSSPCSRTACCTQLGVEAGLCLRLTWKSCSILLPCCAGSAFLLICKRAQGPACLVTEEDPVMLGQHLPALDMSFVVRLAHVLHLCALH